MNIQLNNAYFSSESLEPTTTLEAIKEQMKQMPSTFSIFGDGEEEANLVAELDEETDASSQATLLSGEEAASEQAQTTLSAQQTNLSEELTENVSAIQGALNQVNAKMGIVNTAMYTGYASNPLTLPISSIGYVIAAGRQDKSETIAVEDCLTSNQYDNEICAAEGQRQGIDPINAHEIHSVIGISEELFSEEPKKVSAANKSATA